MIIVFQPNFEVIEVIRVGLAHHFPVLLLSESEILCIFIFVLDAWRIWLMKLKLAHTLVQFILDLKLEWVLVIGNLLSVSSLRESVLLVSTFVPSLGLLLSFKLVQILFCQPLLNLSLLVFQLPSLLPYHLLAFDLVVHSWLVSVTELHLGPLFLLG